MSNDLRHRRGGLPGPYKLTEETQNKIVQCLRRGAFIETAAAFAGIHRDTLFEWMKLGAKPRAKPVYKDFVAAVAKAMAEAEVLMLDHVAKAEEWQAAAWRLERRYPDRWGRVDRLKAEHMGKDGAPLAFPAVYVVAPTQAIPADTSRASAEAD